jgi:hypothetical protein
MPVVHQSAGLKKRVYATLTPDERAFAERLLQLDPNYRYDRGGLPGLDPVPAPGLASAVAASKVITAWIKSALRDRSRGG